MTLLGLNALRAIADTPLSTRDAVCYHYSYSELAKRDLYKLANYDEYSILTWSDGTIMSISWLGSVVSVDNFNARPYQRNPATLKVLLDNGSRDINVSCFMTFKTHNSVCFK